MLTTVTKMTRDEVRTMIEEIVDQKLSEILSDPDQGLTVRKSIRERLQRQTKSTAAKERGRSLEDVVQELGLGQ